MAFDGIVVNNVVNELKTTLLDSRITRISQPEKDEIILTIKGRGSQHKLLLSAGASLPLIYLTNENKQNPLVAPNFCMLLRKHLNNSRILDISQPGLERIVNITVEHRDELGDLRVKHLIIELMGKHSNIIFCDDELNIIDSIKRVNQFMSSVRQVLPGYKYFIPNTMDKHDPLALDKPAWNLLFSDPTLPTYKTLYINLTGISPLVAREICFQASLPADYLNGDLSQANKDNLFTVFQNIRQIIKSHEFSPNIVFQEGKPKAFSSVLLKQFSNSEVKTFASISQMLEEYYGLKSDIERIQQKSSDLRQILNTSINRVSKKHNLQTKQLKDTAGMEKYKVYGELIMAYGYNLEPAAKSLTAQNYYDNNKEIEISLKPDLSPIENANRYFQRYNKLKRTHKALNVLIRRTKRDLDHLESIKTSLDMTILEEDLTDIREELVESGYIKRKTKDKKKDKRKKSKPHHYISQDGFDIYVGKNNYQNDELTFKTANNNDLWFHSKDIPGSHVIIKSKGQDLPISTIEEGASLAAYYSSSRASIKVEVDYTPRKHVKKPRGGKPGFVIYNDHSSILATTDISHIKENNN